MSARADASGDDFLNSSGGLEQQKAVVVETGGDALEVAVHNDVFAACVAGAGFKAAEDFGFGELGVAQGFGDDAVQQGFDGMWVAGLDFQGGGEVFEVCGEGGLVHVDAYAGDECAVCGLYHDAGEFAVIHHHVVGPAEVRGNIAQRFLHCEAQGHGDGGSGGGEAQDDGHIEPSIGFGVPNVAVATDAGGLLFGYDYGAVRVALGGESCSVPHG